MRFVMLLAAVGFVAYFVTAPTRNVMESVSTQLVQQLKSR